MNYLRDEVEKVLCEGLGIYGVGPVVVDTVLVEAMKYADRCGEVLMGEGYVVKVCEYVRKILDGTADT